jgi:hypothetical protein
VHTRSVERREVMDRSTGGQVMACCRDRRVKPDGRVVAIDIVGPARNRRTPKR